MGLEMTLLYSILFNFQFYPDLFWSKLDRAQKQPDWQGASMDWRIFVPKIPQLATWKITFPHTHYVYLEPSHQDKESDWWLFSHQQKATNEKGNASPWGCPYTIDYFSADTTKGNL